MLVLLLTGCIPGDGARDINNPAGFFGGVWHGMIAPISLIGSFFNRRLSIYEVNNTVFWYDLGFYLAIAGELYGGGSAGKRKKRGNQDYHGEE
jgi:hypothetical protein